MTDVDIANLALSHVAGKALTAIDTTTTQGRAVLKWFASVRDEALAAHAWNFATTRYRLTLTWIALSGSALANNGSGLIRVTSTAHGLSTGYRVHVQLVQGVANANGTWYVTVIDANTFDLQNSVFAGTYTASTGSWILAPLFGWDYQFALPSNLIRVNRINGLEGNEEDSIPYEIEGVMLMCDDTELDMTYVYQHTTYANYPQIFINAFSYLLASYIAQELTGPSGKALDMRKMYEQIISPQAQQRDARQSKGRALDPDYNSQMIAARRGYRRY
jgi:hypothetical protein